MSQKRSKNHHFVPKVLQRAFASSDGRVWYSERTDGTGFSEPEERNIEKTFRIRNFYTVVIDGKASDVYERQFYGKIDDYLGRIIPELLLAFGRGFVPTFSEDTLQSLRTVVFELIKRTPHFTRDFDEVKVGREVLESTIQHYLDVEDLGPALDRVKKDLTDEQLLKSLGRSVRVRATTREMPLSQSTLNEFEVRWAVSKGKHSFIISDLIAYRIGNGGPNGLKNPNVEIWMPISPKIALVLTRDPIGSIPLVVEDTRDHVRQVNEYAVENSSRVASHSYDLLKSLLG